MVHRLLSTGDDASLALLMVQTGFVANFLERRSQTVICTVMDDSYEFVRDAAISLGLTVQRIGRDGEGREAYELIHQGDMPGWPPISR